MVRRQHRQQWRQYWRDGLDEMGLDALVEAAAWQCLHYSVLVPRLDWFLFWCVFFEMIIRMILDAKITKSNSAFWLSQITALVFFIQIEWVPWTAQAKLCGSSSKFPQWPPKVVIFGWGAKHRDMKVRREVTEVTIDNEVLRKAIEISTLPRSRGAKFHNLSCTLSNHGQCLDDASESKFFSELRMKNHSWWKHVDCYTLLHWFIDYMSNMISTIQISILKKKSHYTLTHVHDFFWYSMNPWHWLFYTSSQVHPRRGPNALWFECGNYADRALDLFVHFGNGILVSQLFQFNLVLNVKQVLTISKRSSIQGLQSSCCTKSFSRHACSAGSHGVYQLCCWLSSDVCVRCTPWRGLDCCWATSIYNLCKEEVGIFCCYFFLVFFFFWGVGTLPKAVKLRHLVARFWSWSTVCQMTFLRTCKTWLPGRKLMMREKCDSLAIPSLSKGFCVLVSGFLGFHHSSTSSTIYCRCSLIIFFKV